VNLSVVYLESHTGFVMLPPDERTGKRLIRHPKYRFWNLRHAETLDQIDHLQRRLYQQAKDECERNQELDEARFSERRKQIYSDLYQRSISKGTSSYEKEFIKHYLLLREEKRAHYQRRFLLDQAYFTAREFDNDRTALDRLMPKDL
jgi:hypothetical protein